MKLNEIAPVVALRRPIAYDENGRRRPTSYSSPMFSPASRGDEEGAGRRPEAFDLSRSGRPNAVTLLPKWLCAKLSM